jgi:hypothetical protein
MCIKNANSRLKITELLSVFSLIGDAFWATFIIWDGTGGWWQRWASKDDEEISPFIAGNLKTLFQYPDYTASAAMMMNDELERI